ncbi:MAG: hypothetical protein K6U03_04700 [Firmicutes bacterium]|nr:hypothetical protein [Bacillota bacterium]
MTELVTGGSVPINYLRRIVDWIISLELGKQFRKWISIFLKILAVLALIVAVVIGIILIIDAIQIVAKGDNPIGANILIVIETILLFIVNIIIGIIVLMLYWNRANKINELGESRFPLILIAAILIRLFGESNFIFFSGTGIQILIASMFGMQIGFWRGLRAMYALALPEEAGFIIGVISLVISVLIGAIILMVSYFFGEQLYLFVDIATNVKKIETKSSAEGTVPSQK